VPPVIDVVETNRSAVSLYEREGWRLVSSETLGRHDRSRRPAAPLRRAASVGRATSGREASTPSRSRLRAITDWVARHRPSRNDSAGSPSTGTRGRTGEKSSARRIA